MTIQTHTLSNGFQIVTEHMPGLQSASVGIWVDVGGRHERLNQNGIAHFLEHMAFKGTPTRTALQIAEAIEDVGGFLNAYTSRENTAYYARVLEEDVPLALDVIGDILMNPLFDPADVDIERGVILQEIGMTNDTPDDIVFDWLQEVAYPDQALGRSILGPMSVCLRFRQMICVALWLSIMARVRWYWPRLVLLITMRFASRPRRCLAGCPRLCGRRL